MPRQSHSQYRCCDRTDRYLAHRRRDDPLDLAEPGSDDGRRGLDVDRHRRALA